MSDHQNYCSNSEFEDIVYQNDISSNESENINEEKSGDEFLIALYRERPFLYDKKNRDFKDLMMRENAWNKISKTMIETNCGNLYLLKRFTSSFLFIAHVCVNLLLNFYYR